jgi:hypothetical protein
MRFLGTSGWKSNAPSLTVFASTALALALCAKPVLAEDLASTLATLVDRAQIEDLLVDYYGHLGGADRDLGSYYLEDGILDVNGLVARGRVPIEDLYRRIAEGTPRLPGKFHMLLSNPKVVVNGNSATADLVWTGVVSETPKATPRFVEQGREHDELVKRDGRWYFKYRVITSDGGLPAMFEKSYKQR